MRRRAITDNGSENCSRATEVTATSMRLRCSTQGNGIGTVAVLVALSAVVAYLD